MGAGCGVCCKWRTRASPRGREGLRQLVFLLRFFVLYRCARNEHPFQHGRATAKATDADDEEARASYQHKKTLATKLGGRPQEREASYISVHVRDELIRALRLGGSRGIKQKRSKCPYSKQSPSMVTIKSRGS